MYQSEVCYVFAVNVCLSRVGVALDGMIVISPTYVYIYIYIFTCYWYGINGV